MYPYEFVEECINHPSYNATKISFNDLIQILNQPRDSVCVPSINIFRNLNPYKRQQDFLQYHFFFNSELLAFLRRNLADFFEQHPDSGKPREDGNWCAYRVVDQVAVDFIEFLHKKKENSGLLNRILYYLEPVHRFLSLSGILLNFQSRVVNELNPLRRAQGSDSKTKPSHQKSTNLGRIYQKLKKSEFDSEDVQFFKTIFSENASLETEFAQLSLEKFDATCKSRILLARLLHILFSYTYSTMKPFEGIKSLAVLEILSKENTISFQGIPRIKELFFQMETRMGFVRTDELLIKLMNDEAVYNLMCEKIRKPIKGLDSDFDFFDENLNELLQRIEVESEKFIDWDEFSQYFSYRGGKELRAL